jgi:hypothetical protein
MPAQVLGGAAKARGTWYTRKGESSGMVGWSWGRRKGQSGVQQGGDLTLMGPGTGLCPRTRRGVDDCKQVC